MMNHNTIIMNMTGRPPQALLQLYMKRARDRRVELGQAHPGSPQHMPPQSRGQERISTLSTLSNIISTMNDQAHPGRPYHMPPHARSQERISTMISTMNNQAHPGRPHHVPPQSRGRK